MSVSPYAMREIRKRDGENCWLCGHRMEFRNPSQHAGDLGASVDHVLPKNKGGKKELSNLRLAHRICNSLRGNDETVTEIPWSLIAELTEFRRQNIRPRLSRMMEQSRNGRYSLAEKLRKL